MSMPTIVLPDIDLQTALSNVLASIALGEAGLAHILNAEGMKIQTVIANAGVTLDDLNTVNESITNVVQGAADIETAMQSKLNAVISLLNPQPAVPGILEMAPATVLPNTPYLGGPILNSQIRTITFVQGINIPPAALGSWDVSAAQDGSVMAWYLNSGTPGLYDVYIGSPGGVRANPNSRNLFAECTNLISIDFAHFDTVGVTDMNHMFYNDSSLQSLNLSGFDTSQVTDMSNMFAGTSSLNNLIIGGFDTSHVTTMAYMFARTGLTALNLEFFNTASLLDMNHMFYQAAQLQTLDLSNFDVSHVTNMSFAFANTGALTSLDIRHWVTPTAARGEMFLGSNANITIYVNSAFDQSFFAGANLPPDAQIQVV